MRPGRQVLATCCLGLLCDVTMATASGNGTSPSNGTSPTSPPGTSSPLAYSPMTTGLSATGLEGLHDQRAKITPAKSNMTLASSSPLAIKETPKEQPAVYSANQNATIATHAAGEFVQIPGTATPNPTTSSAKTFAAHAQIGVYSPTSVFTNSSGSAPAATGQFGFTTITLHPSGGNQPDAGVTSPEVTVVPLSGQYTTYVTTIPAQHHAGEALAPGDTAETVSTVTSLIAPTVPVAPVGDKEPTYAITAAALQAPTVTAAPAAESDVVTSAKTTQGVVNVLSSAAAIASNTTPAPPPPVTTPELAGQLQAATSAAATTTTPPPAVNTVNLVTQLQAATSVAADTVEAPSPAATTPQAPPPAATIPQLTTEVIGTIEREGKTPTSPAATTPVTIGQNAAASVFASAISSADVQTPPAATPTAAGDSQTTTVATGHNGAAHVVLASSPAAAAVAGAGSPTVIIGSQTFAVGQTVTENDTPIAVKTNSVGQTVAMVGTDVATTITPAGTTPSALVLGGTTLKMSSQFTITSGSATAVVEFATDSQGSTNAVVGTNTVALTAFLATNPAISAVAATTPTTTPVTTPTTPPVTTPTTPPVTTPTTQALVTNLVQTSPPIERLGFGTPLTVGTSVASLTTNSAGQTQVVVGNSTVPLSAFLGVNPLITIVNAATASILMIGSQTVQMSSALTIGTSVLSLATDSTGSTEVVEGTSTLAISAFLAENTDASLVNAQMMTVTASTLVTSLVGANSTINPVHAKPAIKATMVHGTSIIIPAYTSQVANTALPSMTSGSRPDELLTSSSTIIRFGLGEALGATIFGLCLGLLV